MDNLIQSPLYQLLSQPRLSRFLAHLMVDYIGVALAFFLFSDHPSTLTFILGTVVIGISQHALAILGHEAVHYRICENRMLNDWIGNLFCFFPVGLTVSTYRDFHFPHHRGPNSVNDPEVPLRLALGRNWQGPYTVSRGIRLWMLSFLGLSLRELGIFLKMLPKGSTKQRLLMIFCWSIALAVSYATHKMPYVAIWIVGLVTTYFSMLRFQGWYEHGLDNSIATNRYSIPNWLFRLALPHNIWVHYEHHKYPAIPFYNLEKIRALDSDEKVYSFSEIVSTLTDRDRPTALVSNSPKIKKTA